MFLKKIVWTSLFLLAALALPIAARSVFTSDVTILRADGGSPQPPPIPLPPCA